MQSDWLKLVTWIATPNQSALFKSSIVMLLVWYDIGSWMSPSFGVFTDVPLACLAIQQPVI